MCSSDLSTGSCTIGEVTERFSIDLDEVVRRLSVLLQGGVISINPLAAPLAHQHASSIADVNQRLLHLITGGEQISALLSPVLLQPVPIQPLESFFLQLASTEMPDDDRVQLVSMGVSLAGGSLKDPQGQPIEDPLLAQENLREFWRGFATEIGRAHV